MDGWNTTFLLGRPIFRGELLVSGRVPLTLDITVRNVGIELGIFPQRGIERETKTAQKKQHTAVVAVLIHSPCFFGGNCQIFRISCTTVCFWRLFA